MDSNFKRFINHNIREIGIGVIIIVLAIIINISSDGLFLSPGNLSDLLVETTILIILSMGMMMVIITTGIDLSIGAIMALAGMVSTSVLKSNTDMSPMVIVLIAILVGLAAGAFNGFLISYVNILPIIVTLGTMNAFRGLTYVVSDGSWILQQDMSEDFLNVATGDFLGINNLVFISFVVVVVTFYFLNYTRTGRQIYAVGSSESAAAISGINTKRVKMLVYSLMGALAGLAGVLYVCKFAAAQGETALGYELNVIAACVLGGVSISGGTGKVHGAVLGALLLGMISNAIPLLEISPFWQDALRGIIILSSIIISAIISRRVSAKALERRAIA